MGKLSGLIHKKHRRGKKRRDRLRLAARCALYVVVLGCAAGLSAGIVHVVERPVPPFKVLAAPPPGVGQAGLASAAVSPAAADPASDPEAQAAPDASSEKPSERSELATTSVVSAAKAGRPLP